jgi:predicted DNA-binding WGR domain protein
VRLVRNWGRIGTNGQEKVEEFAGAVEVVVSAIFSKQKARVAPSLFGC